MTKNSNFFDGLAHACIGFFLIVIIFWLASIVEQALSLTF